MRIFGADKHWSVIAATLLGLAAIMGSLNSLLQLSRYSAVLSEQFSAGDWTQVTIWLVLLMIWVLVLGVIVGFFVARHWYGAGPVERSMAPSD